MKTFTLTRGLDIPITGDPEQTIRKGARITQVAVTGDDFVGMKPTMAVKEGEKVATGQLLFTDKKNEGVRFTAPGCGTVVSVKRAAKRKFEAVIIDLDGDEAVSFTKADIDHSLSLSADQIQSILVESGLWCSLRTRPYGKIPALDARPNSLFVTAMDTSPLAADPTVIIDQYKEEFGLGLKILKNLVGKPIYLCLAAKDKVAHGDAPEVEACEFIGPHPAGLPSTHIHFIDPVSEKRQVWQISYNDVISMGHLFTTGTLLTERVISLAGPAVKKPGLITTRIGASLKEICQGELEAGDNRIISGSILAGRRARDVHGYLGYYHRQVSVLVDGSGRGFFSWASPGGDRFSIKPVFISALNRAKKFAMNTAVWGGKRAIFPLGTYEEVMPLDIIPITLLKSLAVGDTEKSQALGCLELIEEDLALCGFVCPGKNNFGPMLRDVLTEIELEG